MKESVLDVMQLFLGNDLFELFTTETNRYHIQVSHKYKEYKIAKWTDVTIQEMKKFMGLLILMGQVHAPTIRLIGSPEIDLEEDKDALILRCVADANPPASIVWRRAGRSEIASLQETLQLRPVGRRDAGLYTCQAQNSVGTSEQLSVQLDVKYPPKILSAGPDRLTTAPLFSPAAFECVADGNPMPTYKWLSNKLSKWPLILKRVPH
uniref:Ig-like domain-containing protein n=1 Tax=Glossina austeni TaxID=7395 RepID=A0A1A9UI31_GLOAU